MRDPIHTRQCELEDLVMKALNDQPDGLNQRQISDVIGAASDRATVQFLNAAAAAGKLACAAHGKGWRWTTADRVEALRKHLAASAGDSDSTLPVVPAERANTLLALLRDRPGATAKEIAATHHCSLRTVNLGLKMLLRICAIERLGRGRPARWRAVDGATGFVSVKRREDPRVTATQLEREAIVVKAMEHAPLGMRSRDIATLIGTTYGATRSMLMVARRRNILTHVQWSTISHWTRPDLADEVRHRMALSIEVIGSRAHRLSARREAIVLTAMEQAPTGLSLKDVAGLLGLTTIAASTFMQRSGKRGVVSSVRHLNEFRWTTPARAEQVLDALRRERAKRIAANKAEPAAEDDDTVDTWLIPEHVLTRAVDKPPPFTRAARSIFDLARGAA